MSLFSLYRSALAALALTAPLLAGAQEAAIRKNLAERVPSLGKIDEITPTPMPGLYELRLGTDLLYTDAEGNFVLQGQLLDTRQRKNLTEERQEKLTAINFKDLPLKNAITIKRGNGKRQLAVFADPNCGYCKRFERDVQALNNTTIHLFLLPILGADSVQKSRQIWCSADRLKTWNAWMLQGQAPQGAASCNTDALNANLALAQKYRITGTPTLVFENGRRVPGAIELAQLETLLNASGR